MDTVVDIIRLIRTTNVGDITFFELIKNFGSVKSSLEYLENTGGSFSKKSFTVCSKDSAEQEIEQCKKLGVEIITYQDFRYPILLQQIEGKPPVLFAKGNLELLQKTSLAVVGSRNASLNGASVATKLVKQISDLDIAIVSGMAMGIDTCAHKASLDKGTIAFLGCGVNIIFPKENKDIYNQIEKKGLLLSTFPINSAPVMSNFPRRNNYIAGISLGTLVVEAKLPSGSLLTAQSAMNYSREVFAVPGNPNDPNSQGCNKLIKEGAILVESVYDMLEIINKWRSDMQTLREEQIKLYTSFANPLKESEFKEVAEIKKLIAPLLSYTPVSIDLLKQEFENHSNIISLLILEMELHGEIERVAGNKIKLTNSI